ncbi:serine/threonine-protein kinase [Streptomyces glaucescens]|uniref:non-specific serine/threonine protein kinase n=1 Tax=Streptomyces glaucescens TaxID=1907 RepID=A0A089Z1F8_STRGA|nr:serine/threonine-protein kinase [Streptomyces glaucescens]AIR99680.1 serine/threonine protein kinase [Streptomyces glaucescens]
MAGGTPDRSDGRIINGRYRLLRTLGAGGMGRVWLAHDEELACQVALKEIASADLPADPEGTAQRIARARSEARHAARLRGHPHVATVHDVVVHEGLPWIVMEYVPDAVDLQAVIRRSGPLPPARVARIGLAVLDALGAGHRVGILHRDVKPANILLAPDTTGDAHARVLLTDYGIALRPESREPGLTATAGILGTPGYLAPERARGEPPTPAADLFSLGATLYCAVEGRGPFDRDGEYATLTALLGEEPAPAVRAGELAPVLQGLLVKDPVRRWAPETVARGLERVLAREARGEGATADGSGASPRGFGPPSAPFGAGAGAGFAEAGEGRTPQAPGASATPGTPRTPHTPAGAGGHAAAGGPYGDARVPHTPAGAADPATPDRPHTPTPGNPHTPTPGNPYAPTPGNPYAPTQSAPYAPAPGGPYAPVPSGPYASGGQPPYPPGAFHHPAAPPPPGPDRRRLVLVAGLVLAVVLAVGLGGWAVFAPEGDGNIAGGGSPSTSAAEDSASPAGPVPPYGDAVGLTEPLAAGDCVKAVWTGTPFESPPNLGVVDCADDWPDGQVVAVDTAEDHADARANGARRCADQTRALVEALPDAGGYAVLPTREGFDAAGGGTACLVLGRHAAIGGEVGRFRDSGTDLWVGQMSVGDCWIYKDLDDGYEAPLTDCAEPHTDQVIGTAQAPAGMSFDTAGDNATKLCSNKFESNWAPGPERAVFGWMADEEDWEKGFTKVVCTVSRVDNEKTTGKISAPGAV